MIPSFLLRPASLVALRVAPAAAGAVVFAATAAVSPVPFYARAFAIGLLAASVFVVFILTRDDVRKHLSIVLAIVAVAFTGTAQGGPVFITGSSLFALVILVCVRAPLTAARIH